MPIPSPANTAILIVAAGSGQRTGGGIPKQFRPLGNKLVVEHSINAFADYTQRVLVVPAAWQEMLHVQYPDVTVITGGDTRQASVKAGLAAIESAEYVFVHDAARPFVQASTCQNLLAALRDHPVVIPVLPVADTIKEVENDTVTRTIPRDGLVQVQTPQAAKLSMLRELHAQHTDNFTDDGGLFEAAGVPVQTVAGHPLTFKLTTLQDFAVAENLVPPIPHTPYPIPCIGTGYDVHAFTKGDHVMLGGVRIPHTHGLAGHSDADVLLHALVDAILGAIGGGDIGQHFPPSEERWRGAPSHVFVAEAMRLMQEKGFSLGNADLTVIGEKPKIGPHRQIIQQNVAGLLGVAINQVNIKATTTEKLGFTGREEGLAAMASVLAVCWHRECKLLS